MTPTTTSVSSPADEAAASAELLGREQFAGSVLMILGLMHLTQAVAAFSSPDVYSGTDYAYAYNLDAWGWGLLVLGVVTFGIGVGLLFGQEWARILGILVAMFSALVNFMMVPQAPAWALLSIGLDVAVVWAVAAVIAQDRPRTGSET